MTVNPVPKAETSPSAEMVSDLSLRHEAKEWWTVSRFTLGLGGLLFALYAKLLLGWQTFFYRDFGVLGYPFVHFHRESIWRGEWPMWNPLSNCGAPFLAQWGTMTLYPFSIIYLLFPLPWSLSVFCLAHLVLGGVGIYRLALRWTDHSFAASVAGFAFVFNGITLSSLSWPNYTVALGWLPWIIFFAERGGREGGRYVVLAAVAAALQLLVGVPEIVLFTWLVVGAFGLMQLWQDRESRGRLILRLGLMVLLAAGLAAVQLLPFFDLLAHSQRDRFFATNKWSMPGWGWANFLVPMFHYFQTPQGTFFQFGQLFFPTYYMGIPLVVLGLWALVRVRTGRVWMLGGLLLFSMVMALGENGFIYTWIRDVVPLIGVGRYSVKFIILAAFLLPMLAAFAIRKVCTSPASPSLTSRSLIGMGILMMLLAGIILWIMHAHPFTYDRWTLTWKNTIARFLFLGVALAVLLASLRATTSTRRLALQATFILTLAVDVHFHLPNHNPTLPAYVMAPDVWKEINEIPPPVAGQSRLMISTAAEEKLLRSEVTDLERDFMGKRLAEWSNLNLLDGIPKINGSSTLQLRHQAEVQKLLYDKTNSPSPALLDFLGTSVVTAPQEMIVWSNRNTQLPWITCGQEPIFIESDQTLAALGGPDFSPREHVIIDAEHKSLLKDIQPGACRILSQEFSDQKIRVEVEATAPSVMVIAQSYYHPWQAETSGRTLPLIRANHAFQAILVPAGNHMITVSYRDRNFHLGLGITGISLLFCAGLWWRGMKSQP